MIIHTVMHPPLELKIVGETLANAGDPKGGRIIGMASSGFDLFAQYVSVAGVPGEFGGHEHIDPAIARSRSILSAANHAEVSNA